MFCIPLFLILCSFRLFRQCIHYDAFVAGAKKISIMITMMICWGVEIVLWKLCAFIYLFMCLFDDWIGFTGVRT